MRLDFNQGLDRMTLKDAGLPGAQSAQEFSLTLPEAYRQRFSPAEIAAHAHITFKRGERSVSVGTFPSRESSGYAICVSAVDRPGLLSLISRALNESGYDIDSAEAFRRQVSPAEALDVFWIRSPKEQLDDQHIEHFAHALEMLVDGVISEHPIIIGPAGAEGTTVRFMEGADGGLAVLEVETTDRSGLLYAITRALHRAEVQIITSQIRTHGSMVFDRFTIEELDGSPISNERRLFIQVAVLSAL
jgi:[protein-PII] uridylyltransferase